MYAGYVLEGADDAYTVDSKLGEGGFGVTWKATRRSDAAVVVIKQLRFDRLSDLKALELFDREAAVLQRLDHPRIPKFVDHLHDEQHGYLVQTFVTGENLAQAMRRGRRLSQPDMRRWFGDVLDVLTYLHGLSPPVIHRDISPKNVMLDDDGHAWLIDFGTVQAALRSAGSFASTAAGTFGYAPMEQFVGRAAPASDLYSLAMTYLAVQTGQEPETLPFVGGRIDARAALAGTDVPAALVETLHAMTDPDMAKRPETAAEAARRAGLAAPVPSAPAARPSPAPAEPPVDDTPAPGVAPAVRLPAIAPASPAPAGIPDSVRGWPGAVHIDVAEAHARSARLSPDQAWPTPPGVPLAEPDQVVVSDDGRRIGVVLYGGIFGIDVATWTCHALHIDERTDRRMAWAPDGSRAVVLDHYAETLRVIDVDAAGAPVQQAVHTLPWVGDYDDEPRIVVSPDGQRALIWDDEDQDEPEARPKIVHLDSGATETTLPTRCAARAGFAADGAFVWAESWDQVLDDEIDEIHIFPAGGERQILQWYATAFAVDGSMAAHVSGPEDGTVIVIERIVGTTPLETNSSEPVDIVEGLAAVYEDLDKYVYSHSHLRWSPDGRRLVFETKFLSADVTGEIEERYASLVRVVDVERGLVTHAVYEPWSFGGRFESVDHIAFVGERSDLLLVFGTFRYSMYQTERGRGAALYRLHDDGRVTHVAELSGVVRTGRVPSPVYINGRQTDGRSLGPNVTVNTEPDSDEVSDALARFAGAATDGLINVPWMKTADGFLARLDGPASIGPAPIGPWERVDAVRATLANEPVEDLLDATGRDALQDYRDRRDIVAGLLARRVLDGDDGWSSVVDAVRGLSAHLPVILQRAIGEGSSRPRYGDTSDTLRAHVFDIEAIAEELLQVNNRRRAEALLEGAPFEADFYARLAEPVTRPVVRYGARFDAVPPWQDLVARARFEREDREREEAERDREKAEAQASAQRARDEERERRRAAAAPTPAPAPETAPPPSAALVPHGAQPPAPPQPDSPVQTSRPRMFFAIAVALNIIVAALIAWLLKPA